MELEEAEDLLEGVGDLVEGVWELLDDEDLPEGVEDLVEGEGQLLGHQLPEGKIRIHPPLPIPPNLNFNSDGVFLFRYVLKMFLGEFYCYLVLALE